MAANQLSNINPTHNGVMWGVKLLVGLGNPGKEYERTYHNTGRLFADYALKNSSSFPVAAGLKFRKPTASKNFKYLKTESIIFVRSLLFMNESGAAVQEALKFFNVEPEELLIIHDDSDIELGSYKISFGRGAGGHRGAESIIKKLKTKNFWRIRIGIRPKEPRVPPQTRLAPTGGESQKRRKKASEFVLKKISDADEKILNSAFRDIESKIFTGQ